MNHHFVKQYQFCQGGVCKSMHHVCSGAHLLIGRTCKWPAQTFDGVHAAIQPLHAVIHSTKLSHTDPAQFQELTLIT